MSAGRGDGQDAGQGSGGGSGGHDGRNPLTRWLDRFLLFLERLAGGARPGGVPVRELPGRLLSGSVTREPEMLDVSLVLYEEVVGESIDAIADSPELEVGYKYVGRLHGEFSAADPDRRAALDGLRIEVLHHLDAGPRARRSPIAHIPDAAYQEALFREVEASFSGRRANDST